MNPFVVFKQNLLVAALFLLQYLVPAGVAVILLPILTDVLGYPFHDQYVVLQVLVAVLALLLVKPHSDFMIRLNTNYLEVLGRIGIRWAVVLGILLFIGFATKYSATFSRVTITTWVVLTPVIAAALSVLLAAALRRVMMAPGNRRTAVFAGCNQMSQHFAQQIEESDAIAIDVHGFFDDRSSERLGFDEDDRLLGRLSDLADYVNRHHVSVIFVALPMRHVRRVMELLDELRDTTVSIYYLPDVFVFDLIQARTGEILGTPVVAMWDTPFHGIQGIVKRVTDISLATLITIVLSPLMAIVALIIKLTSPGSVIFKQRRYGLDGEEIIVYKFRTMTVSEDGDDFVQAKKNDPRITPIGHFLRRYSLDELPQLFNVLQGRMSLVGPRPHPIALDEQYRSMIKGYMVRHKVLPGVTGLAQINGCRGETARVEDMRARIDYDLDYLRNWSPLLDLKILFLTIFRVFDDEKAY
jgi:putative colanic acid biosynthesis UDP-glucose lipid carrier transferase